MYARKSTTGGLMWKDSSTGASHRGEELKLWGIIGAANYLYLSRRNCGFASIGLQQYRINQIGVR
jgi:hypothetical protein